MPDPILILKSSLLAALIAISTTLVFSWPWGSPNLHRSRFGSLLGIAIGFYIGAWLLGVNIPWPIPSRQQAQDQDRLLLIILPAIFLAELIGALPYKIKQLAWLMRGAIAIGTAIVVLDNTSYIAERNGPGSREWSSEQTQLIFGFIGGIVLLVWSLLGGISRRCGPGTVPFILGIASAGTGIAMLLSGYATGGLLGFPLSAGLIGVAIASAIVTDFPSPSGAIGFGVVGLASLILMGRFFGVLPTAYAVILFCGPVICWLMEIPDQFKGVAKVLLVAIPILIVILLAGQKFMNDTAPASAIEQKNDNSANTPSVDDYLNFGK